jgi:hypothetical protein
MGPGRYKTGFNLSRLPLPRFPTETLNLLPENQTIHDQYDFNCPKNVHAGI